LIPNDVVVKLRVDNPYDVEVGTNDNTGYPAYEFELTGVTPGDVATDREIDSTLNLVNVVPNPYYGYSAYETTQFTTTVKITNLPNKCTVTIYSLDGKFIRQYNRNEAGTDQSNNRPTAGIRESSVNPAIEWDLRNFQPIPIPNGIYLIHIHAPGLGRRTIKWF